MTNDELDLVDTNALVDALARRFNAVLFVAEESLKTSKTKTRPKVWYRNGWALALGLSVYATDILLNTGDDE